MAEYDRCHRAVLSWLAAMADGPIRWRPCCVFTACSIGTTWATVPWKMPCTKSPPCACLPWLSLDSALPDRTTIIEFPPPARAASTGPSIVQDHQSLAGRKQAPWWPAHFGGCHHHWGTQLYQEQRAATRSGDASDQERQSVALWHEGPHWCRCQEWPDPQPSHHRGQRAWPQSAG